MRSTHNNLRGRRVTAATMAVALVLGGGAVVASSDGASGSSVAKGIALAKSHLANYTAIPTFKAPGPAFNAKKNMKNKIIFSIPVSSSDQFVQTLEDGALAAV